MSDIGPIPRRHAMAYDAKRQRVVLFGDQPKTGRRWDDAW